MSDSYHNNSSRFLRMLPEPCRHHCHREFRILHQNETSTDPHRRSGSHINTSHSSPFCHHSFIPTGTLLTTLRWGKFLCTSSDEKLNMELTSSFWNLVAFYEPVSASPDDFVSSLCVLLVDIYRNFIICIPWTVLCHHRYHRKFLASSDSVPSIIECIVPQLINLILPYFSPWRSISNETEDLVEAEFNVKTNRLGDKLGDDDDVFLWVDDEEIGRDNERAHESHKQQKDERALAEENERLLSEWEYWGERIEWGESSGRGSKSGDSSAGTKSGKYWTSKTSKRCRHPSWKGKSQGDGWQGGWHDDGTHDDRWQDDGWQDDERHDGGW